MELLLARVTEASAEQLLAALLAVLWLMAAVGWLPWGARTRRRTARRRRGSEPVRMLFWFAVSLALVLGGFGAYRYWTAAPPSVVEPGSSFAPAGATVVRVARVQDGDSVLARDGTSFRLHGIDAPEYDQPYGREARRRLAALLSRGPVYVLEKDRDRYGRPVVRVWTDDGTDVNRAMGCDGAAWRYRQYALFDRELSACQQAARRERMGLWALPDPVPPWEWRRK